jgi:hypothetical protein
MILRMAQPRLVSRGALSRGGGAELCLAGLCAIAAVLSGCAAQQKPRDKTFPWATVRNVRPVAPTTNLSASVIPDESLDDMELDVPAPPSPVVVIQSAPQRPRVAVVSAGGGNSPRPPEPPQIAPQLTAEETAAAQQQTSASVSVAERNIAASQGRTLNATQSDLASKVRSFLTEAREAAHVGDWTRASNAAKKAQVLSAELAGSL